MRVKIMALLAVVIVCVAGFMYKDTILGFVGLGGQESAVQDNSNDIVVETQNNVPISPNVALENSCDSGNAADCVAVAKIRFNSYMNYTNKACELGDMDACYSLGKKYYRGDELLGQDIAKAFSFFKSTCDKGKLEGCNNLAVIYNNGEGGIERNAKLAKDLLNDACNKGYAVSCENLKKITF